MPFTLDDSVRVAEQTLASNLEGEIVLLNLQSGAYFGLNTTGTRMWQLLEEHASLRVVVTALEKEFAAGRDELTADLLALVDELEAKKLLERA